MNHTDPVSIDMNLSSCCRIILILTILAISSYRTPGQGATLSSGQDWKVILEDKLPLLGHRNWILVVDKAFPEQSSAGMTYLYTGEELLPTLRHVLDAVESSSHVSPTIYRDRELAFLSDKQVPGMDEFKSEMDRLLAGREVESLLHDEVFGLLDESSSLFRVLVIKTSGTLPYTSVFLQLDCAYWNAEQEAELRRRMEKERDH